ncbi:SDR family oxidoreductase [Phyllobacterium sp. TAF24]|uniref:SDR family oxidoreductase n=1 Tax=Phyllobacterium sp. TAF24 TaxID=3233068 RepID=UPI003F983064
MKVTVVGASGLIGALLVGKLRRQGLEVIQASRSFGINTITGDGLNAAMAGADIVIDVTNSASFGDSSALEFFKVSTENLLAASVNAGHYLALSVVGTPRLVESDYFRAKMVQENLIRAARRPYTLLHSTQFFEFISGIIDQGADGDVLRLPSASVRPIAAADVVEILAELAIGTPKNSTVEIGGPEQFGLDEIALTNLAINEDTRQVISDDRATYYGVKLNDDTLLPLKGARLASMHYVDWLYRSMAN